MRGSRDCSGASHLAEYTLGVNASSSPGPIAVYPGSFDPVTHGHLDIVGRAAGLFERVVMAVGRHPSKRTFFPVEQRLELLRASLTHLSNVEVSSFDGLVVDFCQSIGARALVRGLRAIGDFESEFQMGLTNRDLAPGVETVFLIPTPAHMYTSSSLIREIAGHGGDVSAYVPAPVVEALAQRREAGG